MPDFKLPNDTQRCTVIGRTGSGKTQGAVWQLSERSINSMPWVVFDFKRDGLISRIPYSQPLALGELPDKPGVYIVRPNPGQEELVEAYLWKIWEHENIGIFVDEGLMFKRMPSFVAILTQGRSKRIPAIILTQRPTEITRFAYSEADYFQIYRLLDKRDIKTVNEFVDYDFSTPLPRFYSVWYDGAEGHAFVLRPVPDEGTILQNFADRLRPQPEVVTADPEHFGQPDPPKPRFILI